MRIISTILMLCSMFSVFSSGSNEFTESPQHLDFNNVNELIVDSYSVDIEVLPSYTETLNVDVQLDENTQYNFKYEIQGNTVKIWLERNNSWNFFSSDSNSLLKFYVPSKLDIKLTTASGDGAIEGIHANKITIDTSSGDFDLDNINASITADSSSGYFILNRVEGDLQIASASGNLQLNNCRGKLQLSSISGNIKLVDAAPKVSITSVSGDIYMSAVSGVQLAETVSGSIQGLSIHPTEQSVLNSISGNIDVSLEKNPEIYRIEASSISGSLNINPEYKGSQFLIRCSSTSGNITVQ